MSFITLHRLPQYTKLVNGVVWLLGGLHDLHDKQYDKARHE